MPDMHEQPVWDGSEATYKSTQTLRCLKQNLKHLMWDRGLASRQRVRVRQVAALARVAEGFEGSAVKEELLAELLAAVKRIEALRSTAAWAEGIAEPRSLEALRLEARPLGCCNPGSAS